MNSLSGEPLKDLSSQSASPASLAKSSRTRNQPKPTKDISSLSSSSVPKESITPLRVGTPKTVSTEDILAERGSRYGDFKKHAQIAQLLKETIRAHMGYKWTAMANDQQEALDMICHKIGRIANGDPDYSDSWHDIAGYAKLVADRLDG